MKTSFIKTAAALAIVGTFGIAQAQTASQSGDQLIAQSGTSGSTTPGVNQNRVPDDRNSNRGSMAPGNTGTAGSTGTTGGTTGGTMGSGSTGSTMGGSTGGTMGSTGGTTGMSSGGGSGSTMGTGSSMRMGSERGARSDRN